MHERQSELFSNGIDTQTMYWATGVEEFCSAVMFWWVWRQDRTSQWIWWGIASAMRALGSFVYFLVMLDFFGAWKWPAQFTSIWLIMFSGWVSMVAITRLIKSNRPSFSAILPVLIVVISHFLISWFKLDPRYRVASQSLALAYAMGWMANAVVKAPTKMHLRGAIAITLAAWAALQLARAITTVAFTSPHLDSSYAAAVANSWYYLVYQFAAMALTVVLLSERNKALLTQLNDMRQEAVVRADTDGLTGLLNHKAIMEQTRRMILGSKGINDALAVVMLDCDYFKKVNDAHGHQVGDAVLMALGGLIAQVNWPGCLTGRYGGEEFLLLLPGADEPAASQVVGELMETLRKQPIVMAGAPIFITVSAGIAVQQQPSGESPFELVRRADFALLKAKENGRDRWEVSRTDEMEAQSG